MSGFDFNFSMQNVTDAQGVTISLTGMVIVFFVLLSISVAIALIPKILPLLNKLFPPVVHGHAAPAVQNNKASLDESVVAAIALAIHSTNK